MFNALADGGQVGRPGIQIHRKTSDVVISDPIESRRRQFDAFRQTLANLCARLSGQ